MSEIEKEIDSMEEVSVDEMKKFSRSYSKTTTKIR